MRIPWRKISKPNTMYTPCRKISKPIIDLTRETDKIKRFELDNDIKIDSSIREIRQMVTAIDAMKKGLSSFKRYVPANLVRQLIESGEEARVGGQEKDISIMFTDIKSFTSISERTAPQEIMVQLSEYFEELTEIILNANGTIDKFIGDSIMAFWGAPLDDPKHPQRVCQAALEMHHKLDELNEKWEREGKARLQTRIGIHTGSSIVGNIGSSDRLNYTILGDSVNLASRLEGINKQYGTSIIASERLKKLCQDDYVFRPIDEVPVKGKSQTFLIYELIGKRANAAPDTIKKADAFETAWELIQNGEWDRAKECIKDYAEDADPLYYLYMEHCDKGIDADED